MGQGNAGVTREHDRIDGADADLWREWGPFLAERSWGTVREDYSRDGEAWEAFTHDDSRSRAYRWVEDGLAGICDRRQGLCLGLVLWNGQDPILKERLYGLNGHEGNHGEDVKECYWYPDAVPSHSWLSWRYHYPQVTFPYAQLLDENAKRGFDEPEFELLDTGVFDNDRYFSVQVDYAKASPDDICMRVTARNLADEVAPIHLLPQLWFRNIWSWGPMREGASRPELRVIDGGAGLELHHPLLGRWQASATDAAGKVIGNWLCCENETNISRVFGAGAASSTSDPQPTPYPKDGIHDAVISGLQTVNPDGIGTKAACWFTFDVPAHESAEVRLRLQRITESPTLQWPVETKFPVTTETATMVLQDLASGFEWVMEKRQREADEFHATFVADRISADEALVMRQGFAGLIWSQQFYRFDVTRWLDGDPSQPEPPSDRTTGRDHAWRHLAANDVILMPDSWEYPWFASWDLAFHCVTMAHLDATMAKRQLLLLLREWYTHPNGQIPAYEWEFSDANPPVHAWAAVRVFQIDGSRDHDFLKRIFHKLLLNFSWWVNRKDNEGNNLFEGGFLGLDNIGPFNRSDPLPFDGVLEQSDGSGWMAMYCLNLLEMAVILGEHDAAYEDIAIKFAEHFMFIASAMSVLWDDENGMFDDVIRRPDGSTIPVQVRSMVGLIPVVALATVQDRQVTKMPDFAERISWFFKHHPDTVSGLGELTVHDDERTLLLSVVSPERLKRVLERVLDPAEFLSDHGLRSLSAWHRDHPASVTADGVDVFVDYEPAESRSGLFGGNSNWRGPVWFPVNYLVIEALVRYRSFLGPEFTVEFPTGSGNVVSLDVVAEGLTQRLISLFLNDEDGRRPAFGSVERLQTDPEWHDLLWFHEYFDGDTGAGLGAIHQTGWTALVSHLIALRRYA
ncbi:MAG: glucosidase [Actinomycetes bacterium]